ncbi:MAG: DrmB family protein, partial [Sandaracinaceae bacterium]
GIRALENPANFVCQGCRRLLHRRDLGDSVSADGRRYHALCDAKTKQKSGSTVVPVRFVGACKKGHLQEFPWRFFVHYGLESTCEHGQITLREGVSGDFNDIRVICTCGANKRLAEARAQEVKLTCDGRRPWLPPEADLDPCKEQLHLLVRTASNGYFSLQISALSIEDPDNEIRDALLGDEVRIRKRYEKGAGMEDLLSFDHELVVEQHGMEAVLAQARMLAQGIAVPRPGIRSGEYLQLTTHAEHVGSDAPIDETEQFVARRIASDAPKVSTTTLVHRLREVIVQFGFTRLEPTSADLQGEVDLGVSRAPLGAVEDWLPAATLQGEGVFFELDQHALAEWLKRPAVQRRQESLSLGWTKWHEDRSRTADTKKIPPFLGMRFYLLHSLSHLLINSIAMECGYSASAIKERIYCGPLGDGAREMSGILLYTGTVGSEGTLGGLVEQGKRLPHHLRRALQAAQLCSNDPICGAHDPKGDPTDRLLEGAACHGCLLIAETSCDKRFNRTLDRALVVPVIGQDPTLAFFSREDFE